MRFFLIIFILTTSITFGQVNDSTVYNVYIKKKHVTEVQYVKYYYRKGQLESEGWIIKEKASPESEIIQVTNWKKYDILEHKYGVWIRYYKDGQVAGIDSMGIYPNDIARQYDYNKDRCLTKIVVFEQVKEVENVSSNWVSSRMDDIRKIHFSYYDCEGITHEEHFLTGYKRTGVWKWYKNGKVIKTKEYHNNKLIKKESL